MSHECRYLETIENDAGDVFDVFRVCVARSTVQTYAAVDLSSGTTPSAAESRLVARPIAEAAQEAVASGALVLPS
jgi:hypothetical protein